MLESRFLDRGGPELEGFAERVARAIRVTEALNRLPYNDQDAIRATWTELTGAPVDETFRLIPPVHSDHGVNIRVGRNVRIGASATILPGVTIGDGSVLRDL